MNVFITGTGTDVGKTFVTAIIASKLQSLNKKVLVYKPIQTGCEIEDGKFIAQDLKIVKTLNPSVTTASRYLMEAPCTPQIASETENVPVDLSKIVEDINKFKAEFDTVIVEGAGGLLVPLTKGYLTSDLIKILDIPIIIVTRPDLGTINHTLLTVNVAKSMGIKVLGLVVNKYPLNTDDVAIKTVVRMIEEYCDAKILGVLPETDNPAGLQSEKIIDQMVNKILNP